MIVKIILNDGKEYQADIVGFDMDSFIKDVNDFPHQMIRFGEIGVAKHTVKIVEIVEPPA